MRINSILTSVQKIANSNDIPPVKIPLTRGEKLIAKHFDEYVGEKGNHIILPRKALSFINNITVLNNSIRGNYDNEYFSRLGKFLIDVITRKVLTSTIPGKNTYYLSFYNKGIKGYDSEALQEAMNFKKLTKQNPTDEWQNKDLADRFHTMLSILYATGSIETVEKVLTPLIKKAFRNENNNLLLSMLKSLHSKEGNEFFYNIVKNSDDSFTVSGYLNGLVVESSTKNSPEEAKHEIFIKMLKKYKLYPFRQSFKTKDEVFDVETVRKSVDNILENIGFKQPNEFIPQKNRRAHDFIMRAFYPDIVVDYATTFQKLEFYGDAVANTFIEKFLLTKNLTLSQKHYMNIFLRGNDTFAEFADKLELDRFIVTDKEIDSKLKADTFEAFLGALHLSYPEKNIYEFLKPFFETKYADFIKKIGV